MNFKIFILIYKNIIIYYSDSISRSINRQTNADFFAELIGVISNIRYNKVIVFLILNIFIDINIICECLYIYKDLHQLVINSKAN